MRRCRFAFTFVCAAVLFLVGAQVVSAQLSLDNAKCRKSIGKAVRKLANAVIKQKAKCYRLSMKQSPKAQGVDCSNLNDPGFPGANAIIQQ